MTEQAVEARTDDGRFAKGVSGNPAGRPKGKKHAITELRQDLELAVRQHLTIDKVRKIVDRMATMAENGSVAAAKLLLDKVIANAHDAEDDADKTQQRIIISIENATFAAKRETTTPPAVEAEFTEVKSE